MMRLLVLVGLLSTSMLVYGQDKVKDLVLFNQVDKLKALVAAKNIDLKNDLGNGYSALHYAVEANNLVLVELFLSAGSDVSSDFHHTVRDVTRDKTTVQLVAESFTPLAIAFSKNNLPMIQRLLQAAPNPNATYDPRAFGISEEPVSIIKKSVDLGNSSVFSQLVALGATLETAAGRNDSNVLLDLAIDAWKSNYIANKISLDAQTFGQNSNSQAGTIVGLIGAISALNFSKLKVLEGSAIISLLSQKMKRDLSESKRVSAIFQSKKWDTLTSLMIRSGLGDYQDRTIEVDLALVLGDYQRFLQAILDNAPLSAMTLIYMTQYDRVKEYQFMTSLGIPASNILLQPVQLDKEVFPNYLFFAYSQGSQNILAQFQKNTGNAIGR